MTEEDANAHDEFSQTDSETAQDDPWSGVDRLLQSIQNDIYEVEWKKEMRKEVEELFALSERPTSQWTSNLMNRADSVTRAKACQLRMQAADRKIEVVEVKPALKKARQ